jgi:hypothetical protein
MIHSDLNATIRLIQEEYSLSADTRNALHGATAGHPWCEGKPLEQRINEARFALSGKVYPMHLDVISACKS